MHKQHPSPPHINISSFAGGGKTTILEYLLKHKRVFVIPQITCRPRRENELGLGEYRFVEPEKFETMREHGDFISVSPVELNGQTYYTGILKRSLWPEPPTNIDLIISLFGVSNVEVVKKLFPEIKLVFIDLKNLDTLDHRLWARCLIDNSDYEAKRRKNLDYILRDVKSKYPHIVYNDTTIEECAAQIISLL